MTKGIGRLLQAGVAKETVRGTSETAATYYIPFSEAEFAEKDERVVDEQSYGIIEHGVSESIVKQWADVSVKAPIGDKHFGLILLAALGTCTTGDNADSDASIKDHTFTVNQSAQHQALSMFLDDPLGGQDYKFALGSLATLELMYEQGKFLEYKASFMTKKGATATLTPSTTTENRFLPQHLTFKVASNLAGLAAASATVIKNLSLTIEKNLEADSVLGNIAPADFLNKQIAITGTIEAIWQNESDFKTAALAGTQKALRIDCVNTGVTIGSAANPRFKIDLAKVYFSELSVPVKINDVMTQSLKFTAYYSASDTSMVSALLTNAVASY